MWSDERGSPADGNCWLFLYLLDTKIVACVDGVDYRVYEFQTGTFRQSCKDKHRCPSGIEGRVGLGANIGTGFRKFAMQARWALRKGSGRFEFGYNLVAKGVPGGMPLMQEPNERGLFINSPEMVASSRPPPTRWSATLAFKVNLHHEIDFRAVSNDKMAPAFHRF